MVVSADLIDRLDALLSGGIRFASVTVEVDGRVDPSAVVFGSRLASDRWFAWEQPDRDGFALAGLGSAAELISRGPDRFDDLARHSGELLASLRSEATEGLPAGAGPLLTGGFAFDPVGGHSAPWSSLPPALLVLPEISIARVGARAWLTATATAEGLGRLHARLAGLSDRRLPMLDPAPGGNFEIRSVRPPSDFERIVEEAARRVREGDLDKVVLARELVVEAPRAHDPAALYGALRELFPACFCFCVGTPEAAFVGASPELLLRRAGQVLATVALAGSTRRSADPAVDDHLAERLLHSAKDRQEHEIVVRRIERTLRSHSVWVAAEPEPGVVKVANIQHLGTPIHAQLAEARSAVEIAGLLHPTPAVGGEPRAAAERVIAELEGMDRGWYTGPVGWMDSTGDGEFCVALRSGLLRDRTAHLYAGGGVVGASEAHAELAETEVKLQALLPLLSA